MAGQSLPTYVAEINRDASASRWHDQRRLMALGIFLLAAFGLAYSFNYPSIEQIRSEVHQLGLLGPLIFILVYMIATLFFVPKNVMSIAAGGVFGLGPALVYVLIGATLGSVMAFLGARKVGRVSVERLAGQRISLLDQRLGDRPFLGVLIARLIPVIPFTLLNYAAGLSSVGFLAFLGATVIGMLPGTASYVAVGAYGIQPHSWEFALALLVLLAFGLLTRKIVRSKSV